jgi:urease accessory protein
MFYASSHHPAGHWPQENATVTVTLDFEARHRRRIRLTLDEGGDILLDLPEAVAMADGDGLQLNDGRWVKIQAALEPIVEITHRDPTQFARLAWHLGNRHLPAEIQARALRIRPDHVIEQMMRSLGAEVVTGQGVFQPEGGAYGGHGHA